MRRTLALSLALSLSLGLLSGCGPAAPAVQAQELTAQPVSVQPAGSPAVDQALTSFGLSLLQKILNQILFLFLCQVNSPYFLRSASDWMYCRSSSCGRPASCSFVFIFDARRITAI